MESDIYFIGLLAIFFFVGVPILAIVTLTRVKHLEVTLGQMPQLVSRVFSLEQRLAQLEAKLAAVAERLLERKIAVPPQEATPVVPGEAAMGASPPVTQPRPVIPAASTFVPSQSRAAAPAIHAAQASFPLSASTLKSGKPEPVNFEALVAGSWLHYIGILAILFAVTFFLKYAFENNWIGPRGRVGIGLMIGAVLFPFSHRLLNRGYKYFSEGIAGLGAAVLYLSLWAGWHYYGIFSLDAALVMMIAVTALTTFVAIGRNSERIATLALIGGILTPALVSTGENHEVALFTYMVVLGAGMLVLARILDWTSLPPIQFAATLIYFWGWYGEFYNTDELGTTLLFATLFFLLFAALPVARSRQIGELPVLENLVILANSLAYLIALRMMLWPTYRWSLTIAVLLLAAVHLGIERMLPEKEVEGPPLTRIIFAGLALTFATLAAPIRLDDYWITIAWSLEGAVLVWTGLRVRITAVRAVGYLLFAVAACRLAFMSIPAPQFLFNVRFATFAVTVGCFLSACYFPRQESVLLREQERAILLATAIAANIYGLAALSLEMWDYFERTPSALLERNLAQQFALSALWLIYALTLLVAGLWKKSAVVRWQALALLGIVIVKVFLFDLSFLERFYRIISFLLLGLALMVISFFYQRRLAASRESGTKA